MPLHLNKLLVIIQSDNRTGKLSTAGEEGLDVILMEAVVLQHSIELLKILNVSLERDLLLPAACRAPQTPRTFISS